MPPRHSHELAQMAQIGEQIEETLEAVDATSKGIDQAEQVISDENGINDMPDDSDSYLQCVDKPPKNGTAGKKKVQEILKYCFSDLIAVNELATKERHGAARVARYAAG